MQKYTEDQIHEHIQLLQQLPVSVFVKLSVEDQVAIVDRAVGLIGEPNFPAQHSRQVGNLLQGLAVSSVVSRMVQGKICDCLENKEINNG